jgi:hypothetical protein
MRFTLLVLFLATFLNAEESEHTCRTLFLNGPQQQERDYYLFDGVSSQKIELPRLNLSPVYKVRRGQIKIWLLTAPVRKLEEIPEGAPSETVPAGVSDFYLLIVRDPSNAALPVRMQVVNANYDRLRLGEMLWFNLTAKHLAGKLGKAPLNLGPNTSALIGKPASSAADYPVEIYFRVPGDERTHPLIESQWYHDPRSRSVVFVYDEGKRRAPRIRAFSDFRKAEDPKD